MKKILSAAMVLSALVSVGETLTYEWDGTTTSYGGGKVLVTYADDAVTALTANLPEGETVVFTGTTAVSFAPSAVVTRLGLGNLVFSNDVAAAGNLVFTGPLSQAFAYPADKPLAEMHAGTTAPCLALPGLMNFEDYQLEDETSHVILYSISSNPRASQGMRPYFQTRTDGVLTAQLQGWNGSATRCDAIALWQTAAGVVVSNGWAKQSNSNLLGQDFTSVVDGHDRDYVPGLLKLVPTVVENAREVTMAGAFAPIGTVFVSNKVNVVIGETAVRDGFKTPVVFGGYGRLVFRDCGSFTNAAPFSGCNGEVCYESGDAPALAAGATVEWNGDLGTTGTVVLPNSDLSSVTAVTAQIRWKAYNSDSYVTPTAKYRGDLPAIAYRDYATYSGCRFQADRGDSVMAFAAVLVFSQAGDDVTVKQSGGYYSWDSTQPTAKDPSTWDPFNDPTTKSSGYPYSGTYAASKYSVTNLKIHLSRPLGKRISDTVTLANADTTASVVYRLRPGLNREMLATVTEVSAVPYKSGEIHVHDRARLHLAKGASDWSRGLGNSQRPAKHVVYPGGSVLALQQKENSLFQTIEIAGGTYHFNDQNNAYNSYRDYLMYNYLGHVVYSDGGRSWGDAPYLGHKNYNSTVVPSVEVRGTKPCFCDNGWDLNASCTAENPGRFELRIADVTGDADVDLTIAGRVRNNSGSVMTMVKYGPGTVLFTATNSLYASRPVEIREGTFAFGRNDCFNADQTYALLGGSLAFAANTTNVLASLALEETGGLVLADGADVTVGDSSAVAWTPGKTLNITCDPEKSTLRFGTSAAALTEQQQRRLRLNGQCCHLGDDGTVQYGGFGLMLIVK